MGSAASERSYGTAWGAVPGRSSSGRPSDDRDSSDSGSAGMTPCTPDSAVPLVDAMSSMSVGGDPHVSAWLDGEEEDPWGSGFVFPSAAGVSSSYAPSDEVDTKGSLWDDYEDDEEPEPAPDVIICTVHGKLCKKGICKQYKSQLRAIEKPKEAAQRKTKNSKAPPRKNEGGWRNVNCKYLWLSGNHLVFY